MMEPHSLSKEALDRKLILQEPLLREAPGGKFSHSAIIYPLTGGGSDRIFCRIRDGERSLIFLIDPNLAEFSAYIQIGQFLYKNRLPVPRIYSFDEQSGKALLEDLGDESFFLRGLSYPDPSLWQEGYRKIIDVLITLQGICAERIATCAPIKNRVFDYGQLRWETAYFTRYFLREYCQLSVEDEELEEGFHHLAASFAEEPRVLMHRDFQSQNIIWKFGKPYLIDFQGARQGIAAYDLASLLNDCYLVLDDLTRQSLISYYLDQRQRRLGTKLAEEEFQDIYLRAALQRNMQALGAFGFLSRVKNKRQFEQFIPAGVRYLKSNLPRYAPLWILERIIRSLVIG